MNAILRTLVENAKSAEHQDGALAQLAMLLEKSTRPCSEPDFYQSMLPSELLRLEMTSEDQRELLQRVGENISDSPHAALQFIWAVGKAQRSVALELLDESLQRHPKWIESPEIVFQAIIALDNCLDAGTPETRRSLNFKSNIVDLVKQAMQSKDEQLSSHGNRVANKIQNRQSA